MKVWLSFMALSLTACTAGSSTSSLSGPAAALTESVVRAAVLPPAPVTPTDERTLACLHCAP